MRIDFTDVVLAFGVALIIFTFSFLLFMVFKEGINTIKISEKISLCKEQSDTGCEYVECLEFYGYEAGTDRLAKCQIELLYKLNQGD